MVTLSWFVCPSVAMVTTSRATGLEKTLFPVLTFTHKRQRRIDLFDISEITIKLMTLQFFNLHITFFTYCKNSSKLITHQNAHGKDAR